MQLDEGLDTGKVFAVCTTPIGPNESSGELFERLAPMGAELLERELPAYLDGRSVLVSQDNSLATHARMLTKSDGVLDWNAPATAVQQRVLGVTPWPGATTTARGKLLKVHAVRTHSLAANHAPNHAPGTVLRADKTIVLVAAKTGAVELVTVQLEGKKPIKAGDWVLGRGVAEGDILGVA